MPVLNGELILFVIASALCLVFAISMVVQKKPVMSVLSLVLTFFGLSVLSVLLSAPFIAVLQIIVYAGAILVLFLFVIMLLNLTEEATGKDDRPVQRVLGLATALALGGLVSGIIMRAGPPPVPIGEGLGQIPAPSGNEIPTLGRMLFSDQLLAFEALSFLLLLASVGALILAKRRFD